MVAYEDFCKVQSEFGDFLYQNFYPSMTKFFLQTTTIKLLADQSEVSGLPARCACCIYLFVVSKTNRLIQRTSDLWTNHKATLMLK